MKKGTMTEARAKRLTLFFLSLAMLLLLLGGYLSMANNRCEVTTYAMGSFVQQKVYGRGRENAAQKAANEIVLLEEQISWRVEGSDIAKLNDTAGTVFQEISPRTYDLLAMGKTVNARSGGAFAVTIAPLSRLWDFDEAKNWVPDAALIAESRAQVDDEMLLLDNGTAVLKTRSHAIDIGGIGKGAACEAAVTVYEEAGITRAIVAVGGSVGVLGEKPFGSPWQVAVQCPEGSGNVGELSLSGTVYVSTSGDYEKYFEVDGVRYHHLLDPATGYPADSGLSSVTVLADAGGLSDALATACFVLGFEEGKALLAQYGDAVQGAIFISKDNQVLVSASLGDRFVLTDDAYTQTVYEG